MRKLLRHTKTGNVYPINEHMMNHPDLEVVDVGDDGKVVEPEETGPAADMVPPMAAATDSAEAEVRPTPKQRRTRRKEAADE